MICRICKIDKVEEDFHYQTKKKDKRKKYCKECAKDYRKKYYEANREKSIEYSLKSTNEKRTRYRQFIWDYLSENPCIVCGEGDPIVLEFDHRDPSEKDFTVSEMIHKGIGIELIKSEIKKCDILCSNCHKRRTAIQFNWYSKIKK